METDLVKRHLLQNLIV